MNPSAPPRGDFRVATFTWTPSTGELRTSAELPSLLELDDAVDDDRPLLTRILDHLQGDDVDRLHAAVREVRQGSDPQSVEVDLIVRGGTVRHLTATTARAPGDDTDDVMGVVHDVTRYRHLERALEARHAVTAALANWDVLGFDGLLGPLGSALGAREVTVWVERETGLRGLASWSPEDETESVPAASAGDVVTRAWQLGLPVAAASGGIGAHLAVGAAAGVRHELAFPVVSLSGVLAVLEFRSPDGLWISDTLTRLLGAVGRELGAFFSARPCSAEGSDLSPRERQVLELAAQGLSAPEIAAELVLSPATVRSHMRNVYAKLEVGDRVSAVVKAIRAGLIR